ncbi:vacuolar protein sorting protein VPS34 [Acrasis kona]|uniref:Vacuolar protein sorting protein VPS34 n=1 Tax=Acrasis kona TaxID=1008807 RepID=A0AAW2YJD0_9EUKA
MLVLKPHEKKPYYWTEKKVDNPKLLIKIKNQDAGGNFEWNNTPFRIDQLDDIPIKLERRAVDGRRIARIMNVTVQEQMGTLFVMVKTPSKPPYLIDNQLPFNIQLAQVGCTQLSWTCDAATKTAYAWDDHAGDQHVMVVPDQHNVSWSECQPIDINMVSNDTQSTMIRMNNRSVYVRVDAQGPTRVLRLKIDDGPSRASMTVDKRLSTVVGSPDRRLQQHELHHDDDQDDDDNDQDLDSNKSEEYNFKLKVLMSGMGVSLIENKTPKEVAYIYLHKLDFKYAMTDKHQFIEAKLGRLQIDNQNRDAIFPILFSNRQSLGDVPFLHVSLARSVADDKKLDLFPYFSFNMQEASLQVEYAFVSDALKLYSELLPSNQDDEEIDRFNNDDGTTSTTATPTTPPNSPPPANPPSDDLLGSDWALKPEIEPDDAGKVYFDRLELHPIKINISFTFNEASNNNDAEQSNQVNESNPLDILLGSMGFTFANINDAPICLNALILEHPFLTWNDLMDRIKKHYIRRLLWESYKLVGSLEMIGNPVGLFNDISTGVKDFFYEPAMAITESPEVFTKSLAKGGKSLIGKTLHGAFNTMSNFTGTMSKGVAFLTFDKDLIKKRERSSVNRPKDLKTGLQQGGEVAMKGLYEGATDLFRQPAKGFQQEGTAGLFKGIGRGLIGIPMKPIGGVLEGMTRVSAGISNMQNEQHARVRFPRAFREDGAVLCYSIAQAYAHDLVKTVGDGKYHQDVPIYYMANKEKTHVFVLTDKSLLKVKPSTRVVEWSYEMQKCRKIERDRSGAILVHFEAIGGVGVFKRTQIESKKMYNEDMDKNDKMFDYLSNSRKQPEDQGGFMKK